MSQEVLQRFQRVIVPIRPCGEFAEVGNHRLPGFLPPEPVQDGIGQYALKQHGQLGQGFVAIALSQLHHAVLNDVQGGLFVPDMVEAALEGAAFHTAKEVGQFFVGGQNVKAEGALQAWAPSSLNAKEEGVLSSLQRP